MPSAAVVGGGKRQHTGAMIDPRPLWDFDDPAGSELRLRAAAVVISLATGPYRGQDIDWRQQTMGMIRSAGALVRQVV